MIHNVCVCVSGELNLHWSIHTLSSRRYWHIDTDCHSMVSVAGHSFYGRSAPRNQAGDMHWSSLTPLTLIGICKKDCWHRLKSTNLPWSFSLTWRYSWLKFPGCDMAITSRGWWNYPQLLQDGFYTCLMAGPRHISQYVSHCICAWPQSLQQAGEAHSYGIANSYCDDSPISWRQARL